MMSWMTRVTMVMVTMMAMLMLTIKVKTQSYKAHRLPDMILDSCCHQIHFILIIILILSETELKRLVGQLEKTRNDLK